MILKIYGKDQNEHDGNLEALFQRCREVGIRLNQKKLQLNSESLSFLGHVISKDGLKIDPAKVKAITEMAPPTSVPELRRFLGMVNYVSKFIPNLSEILAPLNNLTKLDLPWNWSTSEQDAFDKVLKCLSSAPY